MNIVAIDMGGTSIKFACIVDDKIIQRNSVSTQTQNYEKLLTDVVKGINELGNDSFVGISISVPGQIDVQNQKILNAGSITCLTNRELVKDLENEFCVPVRIENDGNCALIAEHHFGVGKGLDNLALIILGTGVGGSLVFNNEIVRTRNHFSAEFGYMIFDRSKLNSWEFLNGSVVKMTDYVKKRVPRFANSDGKHIFDLYKIDPDVTEILSDFYMNIAIGIYNIQAMFDPDMVIIGGAISERSDLIHNINEKMELLYRKRPLGHSISIESALMSNDANLIGAYTMFVKWSKENEA